MFVFILFFFGDFTRLVVYKSFIFDLIDYNQSIIIVDFFLYSIHLRSSIITIRSDIYSPLYFFHFQSWLILFLLLLNFRSLILSIEIVTRNRKRFVYKINDFKVSLVCWTYLQFYIFCPSNYSLNKYYATRTRKLEKLPF